MVILVLRLAVLSITNRQFCSVELAGPVEILFADGWRPKVGCIVRTTPPLGARGSGQWVFEVPPHDASWKLTCVLKKHTFIDKLASRLGGYPLLRWTARLAGRAQTTFSSDWIAE